MSIKDFSKLWSVEFKQLLHL